MKVHLIMAPTTFALNHGDLGKGIDPPLGLLYLASYYRKFGRADVDFVFTDGMLDGFEETVAAMDKADADVIAISAVTPTIEGAYRLIDMIKKKRPAVTVILGGPHSTAMPEEAFERTDPDVVVIGEGEETFRELIDFFAGETSPGKGLEDIDGICFRNNNQPMQTKTRRFIKDLDEIPFPARDLVNFAKYTGFPISEKHPGTSLLTSRGCPFNCTFCSNNVWRTSSPHHRVRSVNNIVDEYEMLTKQYGFKEYFDFSDEINVNLEHTKAVLREIIRRDLNIKIKCQIRALPMDEELAELMEKAGVWYVHLGIESGNQQTLKGIRKNISIDDVIRCCSILKRRNIKIWGLFMYFNVWEENGTVACEDYAQSLNTLNFARKLYYQKHIDFFGGSITTPVPGSQLWDIALKHDLIKAECRGHWDMWFYKRELRLVSYYPGVSEAEVFKLHQKTVRYTILSLLKGRLINFSNLNISLIRALYFAKRQILMLSNRRFQKK